MFDIMTLGELLIDLVPSGFTENGIPVCSQNPGGAVANVAVATARLNLKTAFAGKVGDDGWGRYLRKTLSQEAIDVTYLKTDPRYPTTLAVVTLDENGDRSFSFYRDLSADIMLCADELVGFDVTDTKLFHFGSVSMTADPSRTATLMTLARAVDAGVLVSYDPNYRPSLWHDSDEALYWMKYPLGYCDIVKLSEEEADFITGYNDPAEASFRIYDKFGCPLIFITLSERGAFFRRGELTGYCPGIPTKVSDTVGAGDAFTGAILSQLISNGIRDLRTLELSELTRYVTFANKAAAYTVTRTGGIPSMPRLSDLN